MTPRLRDALPTLVPLTPAQARAVLAERRLERATRICRRLGADPERYAAWLIRAEDAFAAEGRVDQVPAMAAALAEILPASAETCERAMMLGLAIGLVVATETA